MKRWKCSGERFQKKSDISLKCSHSRCDIQSCKEGVSSKSVSCSLKPKYLQNFGSVSDLFHCIFILFLIIFTVPSFFSVFVTAALSTSNSGAGTISSNKHLLSGKFSFNSSYIYQSSLRTTDFCLFCIFPIFLFRNSIFIHANLSLNFVFIYFVLLLFAIDIRS